MKTQDTKVHIKLWHRDFWFMALANLLLTMSVYSLLPVIPSWFGHASEQSYPMGTGLALAVFGIGMFAFGCFCSYLVQRFRRNKVCIVAIAGTAACSAALYYAEAKGISLSVGDVACLRFVQGAFYGLAKMVLASTLIIDTCESFQRTEANHSSTWFARFALSLGPLLGLVCSSAWSVATAFLASTVCAVAALVLVYAVSFPFRAPEECVKVASLDRFFLPQGWPLFLNLVLISATAGLLFAIHGLTAHFFGFLMCGFLLSLLARRFVFPNADLKSEAVCGLLAMVAAFLILLFSAARSAQWFVPTLFGLGIGITSSRFLLFFIKLSHHCQRGTSQSTFLLGWELGLAVGLYAGFDLFHASKTAVCVAAVAIAALALAVYTIFIHDWFIKHKNR